MRSFLNILTIFFVLTLVKTSSKAQSQLAWANPYPQWNTTRGICPLDSNSYVICGGVGTLTYGTTNYENWNVKMNVANRSGQFADVCFYNKYRGLVVNPLLLTTDGGATWTEPNSGGTNWSGVRFRPDGVALCYSSKIIISMDGGLTWKNTNIASTKPFLISDMCFPSNKVGYACSRTSDLLIKTTDGGNNWYVVDTAKGQTINSIIFINEERGVMASSSGIYRTTNGGLNWEITEGSIASIRKLCFLNNSVGIGITTKRDFVLTLDSGTTWQLHHNLPGTFAIEGITFTKDGILTAFTINTIYTSSDTGQSWKQITKKSFQNNFYGVDFSENGTGCAVGDSSAIIRSTNKGKDWTVVSYGGDTTFFGIDYFDNDNAIVVGQGIKVTKDGGLSWTKKNSGINSLLYSVKYSSKLHATAVGDSGVIVYTTDGGDTWLKANSGFSTFIWAVDYASEKIGYAVSTEKNFLKTTNAGQTWQLIPLQDSETIWALSCFDTNHIVLVGQNGVIVRTSNAGQTWMRTSGLNTGLINQVIYVDSNNIKIIGSQNGIFSSSNGGESWETQKFLDENLIFSSFYYSKDSAILVGDCLLYAPAHYDTSWYPGLDTTQYSHGDSTFTDTTHSSVAVRHYTSKPIISPNPSSEKVSLLFSINEPCTVLLTLYDVLGNVISKSRHPFTSAGFQEVDWSVADKPNGNYFYELSSPRMAWHGKFIVDR